MKLGKDIDSIFRYRLKGAKMTPPADAWDNILNHLPQNEEKKRILPWWMKLAGVAAILALMTTMIVDEDDSGSSSAESIVFSPVPSKAEYRMPEVSASFNEIMQESEILLQALILQSEQLELREKKFSPAALVEEKFRDVSLISEGSEQTGKIPAYTGLISEGLESALAEEILAEEITSPNEIAEISAAGQKDKPGPSTPNKPESEKRFKLSTRIAPVYFNSFGKGNAINNSFSEKETAGEVTFSYGVNVAYAVSEKLNIRSGINKVDLVYNTRQISLVDIAGATPSGGGIMETTTLASPSNGTLNQKMGFFEIPFEVEVVVLDKRFAVGVIGGGSALFLEEDRAIFNSPGSTENLGDIYSTNKLSFSTNFGLSLGFNVSDNLQVGMEPVVKLPLNTFKNTRNSNPYFFGIYSGFSYKF